MYRTLATLASLATFVSAQVDPTAKTHLTERLEAMAAQRTVVVAHRGDSGSKPENTIPAFESAVKADADLVELDFHETEDGVLVCFHDKTLDRTTDSVERLGKEEVALADLTLPELRRLDAGSWKHVDFARTRVPTLEDALRTIQEGSTTMVEHKAGSAKTLVALLRRMKLVDDVLVQSFDWAWLEEVHRLEPRLTLAALGGTKKKPHPTPELLDEIERTGAVMVHWNHERLRPEDHAELKARGYLTCVYTVDEVADYDKMIALGVDAITTNEPARLLRHLTKPDEAEEPARPKK